MLFAQGCNKLQRWLLFILLWFGLINLGYASQSEVLVVIPWDAAPYSLLVASVENQLKRKDANTHGIQNPVRLRLVNLQTLDATGQALNTEPNQLVIAFGIQATAYALALNKDIRVISSFVSRSAMRSLLVQADNLKRQSRLVSVLFLEQPVSRFVALLHLLLPEAKEIGSIYGSVSIQGKNELIHQASKYQLTVNDTVISESDNPLKKINAVFMASDAVVVLPDKSSFNRQVARWVITLSVKQRVPVIGFSKKYTQAGALASIYSDPDQIGRQSAELLYQCLKTDSPTAAQFNYPKYFKVSLNNSVAKLLGLTIPAASELERKVRQIETSGKTK